MELPLIRMTLLITLAFFTPALSAIDQAPCPVEIFAETGQIKRALKEYRSLVKINKEQDYALLQSIGKNVIKIAWNEPQVDSKLYALYGAFLAEDDEVNAILDKPLLQPPPLQLVYINILKMQNSPLLEDNSEQFLRSPILEIRFHTLEYLASLGHPNTFGQLQALSAKLPPDWQVHFPSIAAKIPGDQAAKYLNQLLASNCRDVRVMTILALTEANRDAFFPAILLQYHTNDPLLQEAIIQAIRKFGDDTHAPILYSYTISASPEIRSAALLALQEIEGNKVQKKIRALALQENLSAMALIDESEEGIDALKTLTQSSNRHVQINALIQRAKLGEKSALQFLQEKLFRGKELVEKVSSRLGTVNYYRYRGHSAFENYVNDTNELKMQLLSHAFQADEGVYYAMAKDVLDNFQDPLAPKVIEDLGKLSTDKSLQMLEHFSEKPADPYVRTYCHVELYRRSGSIEHFEKVRSFILDSLKRNVMIFHNPFEKPRQKNVLPLLSLEKESKLFLDLLTILTLSQDERVIDLLVQVMDEGPLENRTILAGLLLKATL